MKWLQFWKPGIRAKDAKISPCTTYRRRYPAAASPDSSDPTHADVKAISYMKVKATIEPTGLRATPESLNLPGRHFAGTVKDNLVEGVFEIERRRYDGASTLPFLPDFTRDEAPREYLKGDEFIQSDDAVLVAKAREITAGAGDSREAATRLSK